MLNLRDQLTSHVIATAERALSTTLVIRDPQYGWGGKSVGFPEASGNNWVRIIARPATELHERTWTGEECASVLVGIPKPSLIRSFRWLDPATQIVWRADEMTLARAPIVSKTPDAMAEPDLPAGWWAELRGALETLSRHKTERVAARQDLITRRITQFTSTPIDAKIPEWRTSHGDLHWANITAPQLNLLDWEGWGAGPRGLDAATLWAFSLGVPALANRIHSEFAADLDTRSGQLARLFMCIELLRMVDNFGDHRHLKEPLTYAATALVRDLSNSM